MVTTRRHHRYTYADYVGLSKLSDVKLEFLDGDIYAIVDGTADHAALAAEVLRGLGDAVGESSCRVHASDLRIYVEAMGLATFPDGSVIRGPFRQHPPSPESTAIDPVVLLEVTSYSSEVYDTSDKLEMYKTIPTLQDYIVVAHRDRRITVHRREGERWITRTAITGGRVGVESLGTELVVDTIYRNSSIV